MKELVSERSRRVSAVRRISVDLSPESPKENPPAPLPTAVLDAGGGKDQTAWENVTKAAPIMAMEVRLGQ